MNERDLQNLVDQYGLKQETADKLKPYLGYIGKDAQARIDELSTANGNKILTLTQEEQDNLNSAKYNQIFTALEKHYDAASKIKFRDLPPEAQTVIASVALQYGPAMKNKGKAPKFWGHVIKQDWNRAIQELENFKDEHPSRRKKEAARLKEMFKTSS